MDSTIEEDLSSSSSSLPSQSITAPPPPSDDVLVMPKRSFSGVDEILKNQLYLTSAIGLRRIRPHATSPMHIVTVMEYDYLSRTTKVAFKNNCTRTFLKAADKPDQDLYQYFESTTNDMQALIEGGAIVYVHCTMGVSRSATLVIAYLIRHLRWSLLEAMVHVKRCRSLIDPNDGFLKQLQQWERYCKHTEGGGSDAL